MVQFRNWFQVNPISSYLRVRYIQTMHTEPLEVMFFKVFLFLIETNFQISSLLIFWGEFFSSNKKFPTHFTNIFNSNPKFSKMNVVNTFQQKMRGLTSFVVVVTPPNYDHQQ